MIKRLSGFLLIVSAFSALLISGCKDENNNLGLDIQPPYDKLAVKYTDTTTVIAYSQVVDSVRTDETSVNLLGSIADPVFGLSTASIYTQFRLGVSSHDFGDSPVLDSLILSLDYSKIYGDTLAPMTVKVYEVAEQFQLDSQYYSFQSVAVKETLLGLKTFVPDLRTDVIIGTDTLDPHLRINLGNLTTELAEKLFNAPADSMADNSSFLNYFYGLYITAENAASGGSIIYFNLLSDISQMTLYYHNDASDSISYSYVINTNCARFGHFDHDYSQASTEFKSQVIDKDTMLGNSTCYVQSLAGVKTFLRFPHIRNYYEDKKIAVNEAMIFLSCRETEPELAVANLLVMVQKNEEGGYDALEDQLNGTDYFGGVYDEEKNGYWFRITGTLQDLMRSEGTDYGLEIYVSGGSVNGERVILHGPDPLEPANEDSRMKLVITYTALN